MKDGLYYETEQMLKKCKYLVYEYDNKHMTALHWAALRNHHKLIPLLLDYGAKIDCFDIIGRTPLYIAGWNKHKESVIELLCNKARPSARLSGKMAAVDLDNDNIWKAEILHICLKWAPKTSWGDVWAQEGINYFKGKK